MSRFGIAVIGASMRSSMIFNYLKKHSDTGYITGVQDTVPRRSQVYLEQYNLPEARMYSSLDEAMADDRVQAVFIGTPDNEHVEPVVRALQAGKHVYCEKPMAITLNDCDAIIAAAREATSVFYMGMNLRHGPVHEKLHEILQSGRLGRLLTIEANEHYYGGRTYFRRWNRFRKDGGGLWITKACHDFDLLNWMADGKATRVYATSSLSHYKPIPNAGPNCRNCNIKDSCPDAFDFSQYPQSDPLLYSLMMASEAATGEPVDVCLYNSEKDTFDNGIAVVDFDNDVRATYTVNVVSAHSTRQMRLMGTEGSAEGDMETGIVKFWKRHSDEKDVVDLSEMMKSGHGGADDRILDDFFRCCETGDKPRSSWADGRAGVQLGLAARDSADARQAVDVK